MERDGYMFLAAICIRSSLRERIQIRMTRDTGRVAVAGMATPAIVRQNAADEDRLG
jgi:hypothetical protein